MNLETIDVTPDQAKKWLEHNSSNRRLSSSLVDELSVAMLNQTFRLTHQPIAITSQGRVLDGQHRLAAVLKSGMTVPMLVALDALEDTFDVIDSGKRRSPADVVFIRFGHSYAATNAASCRLVAIYDRIGDVTASMTSWQPHWATTTLKLDRKTLAEIVAEHSVEMNSLILDIKTIDSSFRLQAPFLAALYVIRRDTRSPDKVLPFLDGVITLLNLDSKDPRAKLHDVITAGQNGFRRDHRVGFMTTIKAWNLYVNNQTVTLLRVKTNDYGIRPD